MKMRGKTEKIDKILEGLLLRKGITKNILLNKIKIIIAHCFTEEERNHIRVGNVKKKKLLIYVDSASHLYEIKCFKKKNLLEKIREENIDILDICLILDNNRKC